MKHIRKLLVVAVLGTAFVIYFFLSTQLTAGQGLVEYSLEPENGRFSIGGEVDLSIPEGIGVYRAEVDWGDGSPLDELVTPSMITHVYNWPGDYTLAIAGFDADGNPLGQFSQLITIEEPGDTIEHLKSEVIEAQAAGLFSEGQVNSLNRKLNSADRGIDEGWYLWAAFNLDLFAIQGLVFTGLDEWVSPPDIAFDMAEALRGWVPSPD
jgi:hypothetical protein